MSQNLRGFDPDFGSAHEAARAIRAKVISAAELLDQVFARIRQHNSRINAFVTLNEEQARQRAREADEALQKGILWGPLHGVPIVIKDTFETAGLRTTSGSQILENYIPERDAVAVARLKSTGAIIVGKTNMPEFASDMQSYNEVAGVSRNPWNLERTPGGSTGGGAAALASGFGFLELGSDIGGSIRVPSHFCGIFGHKTTLNVVPLDGHIPPPPGSISPINDLGVAGPMARNAQDLRLALEITAGPVPGNAIAYGWKLPSPRGAKLKDYRVGYVLDDPFCPITSEVREVLQRAIDVLRKAGMRLTQGWPTGVNPQEQFQTYLPLLAAAFSEAITPEEIELMEKSIDSPWGEYASLWLQGTRLTHVGWRETTSSRLRARSIWQEYFRTHDAFLMPTSFVPAFAHFHELSFFERTIATSDGERQYGDMLRWICFANLTGCPVTVAPTGRTRSGLPVGIQIMGPYLEDATPIDLSGRIAEVLGGFTPPPGLGERG